MLYSRRTGIASHSRSLFQPRFFIFLFAAVFFAASFAANAEDASGEAHGGQVGLNLTVLGLGGGSDLVNTGPLPNNASGSGSDSFGPITGQVVGVNVGVGPLLGNEVTVNTGVLTGEVSYDNAGHVVASTGAVVDAAVAVDVVSLLGLGITADAIESTSEINGVCGSLTPTGSTTLTNAVLTVGTNDVILDASPAPNTIIDVNALGLAGVTLVLNEQIQGGDGITSSSMVTNALHLTLNISVAGLVTLTGDIVLGHSEAAIDCNTADLSINKTASAAQVTVGDTLTYTVTVTNNGPDIATAVSIEDTLPPTVTVNSITPSGAGNCTQNGSVVTCTWPSIGSGGSENVVIEVIPQVAGTLTNNASAGTDDYDPDPSDDDDSTDTTVNPVSQDTANLSVSKTANPDPVTVGNSLVYTVTVTNAGPQAATNVEVTDTLPAGLTADSISQGNFTCNGVGSNVVTCTLGSLAVGSDSFDITVTPDSAGTITNTAVAGADQIDNDPGNNTIVLDTTVNPAGVPNTDLSITKTASPDPAFVNQPLVYTLTVSNTGSNQAIDVTVTDTLPLPAQSINAGVFSCTGLGTNSIDCSLASLPAGSNESIEITVIPTTTGNISNTASVNAENAEVDQVTIQTTVNQGSANLSIDKSADPDPAIVNQPLVYTLTVSNTGPNTASNVVVTDTLPAGLAVTAITPGPEFSACSQAGNVITCTVANLASGASAQVQIETLPDSLGVLTNNATIDADQDDPDPSDNSVNLDTTVLSAPGGVANLSMSKTANPSPGIVGQPLFYTLTVFNAGPDAANNVVLTDTLPAGPSVNNIDSGPFSCNLAGNVLTCTLASLAAGNSAAVVVELLPTTPSVLTNTAVVGSDQSDPDADDNSDTITTAIFSLNDGAAAIPTLSEWGLMLLLGLLAIIGWRSHPLRKQ